MHRLCLNHCSCEKHQCCTALRSDFVFADVVVMSPQKRFTFINKSNIYKIIRFPEMVDIILGGKIIGAALCFVNVSVRFFRFKQSVHSNIAHKQ